jgi:hypothetical protein
MVWIPMATLLPQAMSFFTAKAEKNSRCDAKSWPRGWVNTYGTFFWTMDWWGNWMNIQNYQQLFGFHRQRFEFRPSHHPTIPYPIIGRRRKHGDFMFMFWVWGPTLASVTQSIFPFPSSETTQGNDILASREDIGATCAVLLDMGHTQPNRLMGVLPAGEWQAVVHLWSRSVSDGKRIQKCVLYPLNSTSLHSTKWPMSRKSFGKSIVQDGCQLVMYLTFKRPIINLLSRDVLFRELLQNGFLYIQEIPGTRVSFLNPWFLFHKNQPGWACWPKWPGTTPNLSSSSLKLVRLWPIQ